MTSYNSVWDAISDTPDEAADMKARADLMMKIKTQPKLKDLIDGKISKFSLDSLRKIEQNLNS